MIWDFPRKCLLNDFEKEEVIKLALESLLGEFEYREQESLNFTKKNKVTCSAVCHKKMGYYFVFGRSCLGEFWSDYFPNCAKPSRRSEPKNDNEQFEDFQHWLRSIDFIQHRNQEMILPLIDGSLERKKFRYIVKQIG